jgi:lipopolysaccharide biosynthesis protein
MAHYDHRGGVGPHVRRQVELVAAAVDRLSAVSTARLTDEARRWFRERAELVERAIDGDDFTSYQVGLSRAGLGRPGSGRHDLSTYDEVVICNDTYVPVSRTPRSSTR